MKRYINLKLWDGVSDELRLAELCVADGKFSDGAAEEAGVEDLQGGVVIPGLIDAHIHLCLDPDVRDPLAHGRVASEEQLAAMRQRAESMLLAGITTARDLGGGAWLELQVRDEIARDECPGPRLICAGQPITSVGGHCHFWQGEAADLPAALKVLRRQCEHGTDLIKIMVTGGNITPGSKPVDSQFDDALVSGVVAEATARERTVAAHCHGTNGIRQAAAAGVRTVEHCSWVGEAGWGRAFDESVVTTLVEQNVYVSPTINAGWKRFKSEEFVNLFRNKNCRRFIENENSSAAVEHLDDLDSLALADSEFAHRHVGVEHGTDRLHDLFNTRPGLFHVDNSTAAGLAAEDDVLEDREVVSEHEVLMHHADSRIDRVTWRLEFSLASLNRDGSRIRFLHSVESLHQR